MRQIDRQRERKRKKERERKRKKEEKRKRVAKISKRNCKNTKGEKSVEKKVNNGKEDHYKQNRIMDGLIDKF